MKEKITYEQIIAMDLPNIIVYAAPVMFILVALEWVVSYKRKQKFYDGKDTFAAAAVGLGNVGIGILLKVLTFGTALFFYNLVPWHVEPVWWSYIVCFIWLDFWRYWAHRIAHENRFWWATHVTHHSSKKYNLSVSFRLGWTQYIKIIFFIPVMLVAFHPVVFFICHQIAVLYQFWIHTEYIEKLPRPIEYFFTTPSHHRVHHSSDEKYLDKNYGSTFIIWDRIFGTFQPEEERPTYGITTDIKKPYNPVYLVFHEWMDIAKDIKKARTWKDRARLAFGRPAKIKEIQEDAFNRASSKATMKVAK